MATDSYAILWLGTEYCFTSEDELEQVTRGEHKLIQRAKKTGLESFCDRFSFNLAGDPVYSLLIGECLAITGHKEGVTKARVQWRSLPHNVDRVKARLERAGIARAAQVRMYFHVELDE
jgi:hypothetical protein